MTLSVEARQRISKEIAERWADRREENLMKVLEDGFLVFAKGKPRERLQGYLSNTLDVDVPLVTDPDYMDKLKAGAAPLLYCIQRIQQREIEAGIPDPMTGQPMEPRTPMPPLMWVIIATKLPPYVFERISKDFASLLKTQDAKEPERAIPWGVRSI